jgi:hypothetical protein
MVLVYGYLLSAHAEALGEDVSTTPSHFFSNTNGEVSLDPVRVVTFLRCLTSTTLSAPMSTLISTCFVRSLFLSSHALQHDAFRVPHVGYPKPIPSD